MPQQMASQLTDLNVVDVYDMAASIGKEFEKLIDGYGPETVSDLMPKVITVLEQLEELTDRNQKENGEIEELTYAVQSLQNEKMVKAEEREKYEKELEQIEETWQQETKEMLDSLTMLQEDNRKLRVMLREKEGQEDRMQRQDSEERRLTMQLQDMIHKQRHEIRTLTREAGQKNVEIEAMQSQLEHLTKVNQEYRRKTIVTEKRAQSLIQEQVDLQSRLHDTEQEIQHMKEALRESQGDSLPQSPSSLSPQDLLRLQEHLESEGKVVVDKNDPDGPRFSLKELEEMLLERNDLKTKLGEVEEELESYRPPDAHKDEEDPPVQGPINKEPDEKLFPERYAKKKESGIRKLFQRFLEKLNFEESSDDDAD